MKFKHTLCKRSLYTDTRSFTTGVKERIKIFTADLFSNCSLRMSPPKDSSTPSFAKSTSPEDVQKFKRRHRESHSTQPNPSANVSPNFIAQHDGDQSAHLSDVVEVITRDDPTFSAMHAPQQGAYVQIVEQPAPKSLRFRYECEGRSAGSIPGVNSAPDNKTFPTIKVCGYRGNMIVVVSCVTKDKPYKAHPHNLVGRDCQRGVCTVKVRTEGDADWCQVQFKNIGIQCVKRRDVADSLRMRQDLKVDPYKMGYSHKSQPQSIDLNAVRLCFQVFLTDDGFKVERVLAPVTSEVVYDKKAMSDLCIVRSSHCSGPSTGGTTVILLCERVTREDTEIRFFHEGNGAWLERVPPDYVHKQVAVVFKTPPYADRSITHHVTVQFQLCRISDGTLSNVYNFEYIPPMEDTTSKKRKRLSYNLQEFEDRHAVLSPEMSIKTEPTDRTPPHPMSNPAYAEQQWAGGGEAWPPDRFLAGPAAHQNIPNMQMQHMQIPVHSPMGHSLSPMGHSMSPMGQVMSPMGQSVSPMGQSVSPMGQSVSPMGQVMSPGHCVSPMGPMMSPTSQRLSPMSQCMSPMSHCVSPTHASQQMMQVGGVGGVGGMGGLGGAPQQAALQQDYLMHDLMGSMHHLTYTTMESGSSSTPSITALLAQGASGAELSASELLALGDSAPHDLSDSLTRLSTRELLQ